jgi:hypothetical protein
MLTWMRSAVLLGFAIGLFVLVFAIGLTFAEEGDRAPWPPCESQEPGGM